MKQRVIRNIDIREPWFTYFDGQGNIRFKHSTIIENTGALNEPTQYVLDNRKLKKVPLAGEICWGPTVV